MPQPARLAEGSAQLDISRELGERRRKLVRGSRRDEQAAYAVLHHVRNPANRGGDDRQTRRHRLQDRHRSGLVLARQHEHVRRLENSGHVVAVAEQPDRGVLRRRVLDRRPIVRSVTAMAAVCPTTIPTNSGC